MCFCKRDFLKFFYKYVNSLKRFRFKNHKLFFLSRFKMFFIKVYVVILLKSFKLKNPRIVKVTNCVFLVDLSVLHKSIYSNFIFYI